MTSLHNGHILRDPLPGEHVPTIDDRDDLCLDGWSPLALRVRTQALREVGVAEVEIEAARREGGAS